MKTSYTTNNSGITFTNTESKNRILRKAQDRRSFTNYKDSTNLINKNRIDRKRINIWESIQPIATIPTHKLWKKVFPPIEEESKVDKVIKEVIEVIEDESANDRDIDI